MKNKYTFEHDFLMEKFLEEEPQTLDDMIPDCFNDWMERLDVQEVIDFAQEYADELVIRNKKSICCDSEMINGGQCLSCGADGRKIDN